MRKHKHHIVPRHMGGSDDPSNIAVLTVEEHAEAHRILFEQHGMPQDKIAWLALTGQISAEEARILAVKAANTGRKQTPEHQARKMASIAASKAKMTHGQLFPPRSAEARRNLSLAAYKREAKKRLAA